MRVSFAGFQVMFIVLKGVQNIPDTESASVLNRA